MTNPSAEPTDGIEYGYSAGAKPSSGDAEIAAIVVPALGLAPKDTSEAAEADSGGPEGPRLDAGADVDTSSPADELEGTVRRKPRKKGRRRAKETGEEGGDDLSDGEGQPPEPRAMGFSVERMNEEFALVILGSKTVIFQEQPHAPIEEQLRVLTLDAFGSWFANRFTEVMTPAGEVKAISWAKAWLTSRKRRSFSGVQFAPDPYDPPVTQGYLNLWTGFAVKPKAKPNGYAVFRDHLLNNVANGDEATFRWLFGFFADIVQRPRNRIGVALVMRGRMGTGKTKVGEVIGSLFPRHAFIVDDPRYITGQFNAHMATCLLLQADEAVWAGDKAAEGRLKGLITSTMQQIESKGVDPIRLDNYVRVVMTSNEDWVVPAGKDERRFCVLDVNPRCAKNAAYFREMDAELDAGGREALLHDLLAFDLSKIDLRQFPRTEALLEQKIRSLDSIDQWWLGRLMDGTTTGDGREWLRDIPKKWLLGDYIATSERTGIKRKAAETELGMRLHKIVPGIRTARLYVDFSPSERRRTWCFRLPDLNACREAFAAAMEQPIRWPDPDEPGSAPRERPDRKGSDDF